MRLANEELNSRGILPLRRPLIIPSLCCRCRRRRPPRRPRRSRCPSRRSASPSSLCISVSIISYSTYSPPCLPSQSLSHLAAAPVIISLIPTMPTILCLQARTRGPTATARSTRLHIPDISLVRQYHGARRPLGSVYGSKGVPWSTSLGLQSM
ncbi:hypothetical protein EDD18DRAFT_1140420 [Armillaria luteobubalina]|uniref:Uncharacterized protein n=1 Tax=Armillaria luteobubalina TaxID=153913 RepID=A0AA39QHY2_9AGAR|nr:hypothetical protein EDD18DRAFT_1140420 [Armillaria luteobubalina]